jgi:hypothetical protein
VEDDRGPRPGDRHPDRVIEIETAVYFSCLAALDNAAKHAQAAQVIVRI